MTRAYHLVLAITLFGMLCATRTAFAEVPVQRTVKHLPASNGHGAILIDLEQKRLTHFREHLFAAEEPLLDGNGEVWIDGQPQSVHSRDLCYDAYFGLRVGGKQAWLTGDELDADNSGYLGFADGKTGGSGIVRLVQKRGDLSLEQYFFSPQGLPHASFVMLLRVKNEGAGTASGVSVFSLHNFHLGYGRPGVRQDIGENGETVAYDPNSGDLLERAFAGVIVARPLGKVAHHAASHAGSPASEDIFAIVEGQSGDLPDLDGDAGAHDGSISGFQLDLGDLAPGADAMVGVVFAHHGDPFAGATVQGWLDGYAGGKDAETLLAEERAVWASLQDELRLPDGLGADDETLYRQSAVMLAMAQVREQTSFLREHLTKDGEPRKTRFGEKLGDPPATLPATVTHRAHGAILASLPPGEWTVAWIRDGAYAVAALSGAGLHQRARDALSFYLDAEAGRFQGWDELKPYGMPPYQISLVRYYGFGVEETDFNAFGPNLEFDGFGLFLWALERYRRESGDDAFVTERWDTISSRVADAIVALIDPVSGLVRADSSIWETHWNGRERQWAYTNITAARGLCDAARLAQAAGDGERAASYLEAGKALRAAIAKRLTDPDGAIASTVEELSAGEGYWDAAVLDAIAMELFDPAGRIAEATLAGLDAHLTVPAGAGWARNDDRFDHAGAEDLSPWGSEYDSGEWVIVDLRGSVATWRAGDVERSDRLSNWVRDQALANYLEVAEVFDEGSGTYKFNSPMVGFGAGAFILARLARAEPPDPACGEYYDEGSQGAGGSGGQGGQGGQTGGGGGAAGGAPGTDGGCGCRAGSEPASGAWLWLAGLALLALARHHRTRA